MTEQTCDICKHCLMRGNIEKCMKMKSCQMHNSWIVKELKNMLNNNNNYYLKDEVINEEKNNGN